MIVKEAADFLGITHTHLLRLISSGKLPATKTLLPVSKVVMMNVWDIDDDAVYDYKAEKYKNKEDIDGIK
jgi:hypothetical protein